MARNRLDSDAFDDDRTSLTLLSKIRDLSDQEAWARFVSTYKPILERWCLRQRLHRDQADEVIAAVLERLARAMPRFQYDPTRSFRAWLSTVVRRAMIDLGRQARTPGARGSGDTGQHQRLARVAENGASEIDFYDLTEQLDTQLQHDLNLSRAASNNVRRRVEPHVWQAFWLTAIEDRSGRDAAEQLGIKVAHVFVYKNRVIKMLREEVACLEHAASPKP